MRAVRHAPRGREVCQVRWERLPVVQGIPGLLLLLVCGVAATVVWSRLVSRSWVAWLLTLASGNVLFHVVAFLIDGSAALQHLAGSLVIATVYLSPVPMLVAEVESILGTLARRAPGRKDAPK
jgi:hypothetical protein